jgi:predicted house-cleaning noncanonical NTP pyrophosphatase (MazG superfamily)
VPLPTEGKLVRDRIPDVIRASGGVPVVTTIARDLRLEALMLKLREECAELVDAPPAELLEEVADVFEVLRGIASASGATWEQVEMQAAAKREERGGFVQGVWLVATD